MFKLEFVHGNINTLVKIFACYFLMVMRSDLDDFLSYQNEVPWIILDISLVATVHVFVDQRKQTKQMSRDCNNFTETDCSLGIDPRDVPDRAKLDDTGRNHLKTEDMYSRPVWWPWDLAVSRKTVSCRHPQTDSCLRHTGTATQRQSESTSQIVDKN